MDSQGHLPSQINIEAHSDGNLCTVFYLNTFLHYTETFRKKFGKSLVYSLFLVTIGTMPICAKTKSSRIRKFYMLQRHISLGTH